MKHVKQVIALICVLASTGSAGCGDTTSTGSSQAAISSPVLSQFALYAEQAITLGSNSVVTGGDVGVAALSTSPQLVVGASARVDTTHTLFASSVSLASGAAVGNIETTTLINSGGSYTSLSPFPTTMPNLTLGQISPGGANVTVSPSTSASLIPGAYGAVSIGSHATLTLASGVYSFTSVSLDDYATLRSNAGTTIGVSGSFTTGLSPIVMATTGVASDLVITVSGNDATSPFAPVATIGTTGGRLTALVSAPHGTLSLGQHLFARGAFSAFAINVGTAANIAYQSGIAIPSGPPVNVVPGNTIPAAVASAPVTGALPQSTVVSIGLELPFQNAPALVGLLHNLYDPLSPQYHQFLTPAAFTAQFESASNYNTLTSWATAVGLTATAFANTRLLVVKGSVAQLGAAFGVNFYNYSSASGGQFYAPDRIPTIASWTPALFVGSGFNSFNQQPPPPPTNQNPAQATGSGLNGAFLASDIRSLYAGGTTLDGTGQSLALVEFDDFDPNDISQYMQSTNPPIGTITPTKPQKIPVLSGVPAIGLAQSEVTLDIDMALAMAPNLANLFVFEGPPIQADSNGTIELNSYDVANAAVYSAIEKFTIPGPAGNVVPQVSSSYMMFDGQVIVQSLIAMAAQGQSVFIASGDDGAYVSTNQILSTLGFPSTPFGPFNSPGLVQGGSGQTCTGGDPMQCISAVNFLTVVGGTQSANVPGSNPACMVEAAWNDGAELTCPQCNRGPGGGGVCPAVSLPVWQPAALMTSANNGSTANRNIPDVSALADQVFIVLNNHIVPTGGTSAAAPIWAGFMALTNQLRSATTGLGLLTESLYPLAQSANYGDLFHDVTIGTNNPNVSDPQHFSAVSGYDLATGLGTPRMALIGQLAGASVPLATYNAVTVGVGTGDDDLRSSSQVTLNLLNAQGGTVDQVVLHNFNDPSWSNNTTQGLFGLGLTTSVHLSDIAFVQLIFNQGNCGGCTSDNWNVSSLTVQLNGSGVPPVVVFAEDPFPIQLRLKDNGSGTWPPVSRPTENTTACPTTCLNNNACGVATDCMSGGTCIGGNGVSGSNTGCCEEPSTLCQTNADCPANTTCQFLGSPPADGACL